MKNDFLLREDFQNWLVNVGGFPMASAKSYCSYVAGVDKYVIIDNKETNFFELLNFVISKGNSLDMDSFIIHFINELSKNEIEEKLNKPISTIQKWRSALYQYREFLYNYMESETIIEEDKVEEKENNDLHQETDFIDENEGIYFTLGDKNFNGSDIETKYIYSKQDLYKNFHFRIITQDRYYNNIFYPISFIKRFLYLNGEKKFLDTWVSKLLDNVIIHINEGKIKLNNISKLEITNKGIYVYFNDISKLVLTKKSDNKSLIPIAVKELSKIALDHDTPLYSIMNENIENLVTFKQITNELKNHINGICTSKKLKKANNLVLKSEFINKVNLLNLKKEMELISSLTNLQLMDGIENKSKGSSYNEIIL